MLTVPLPYINFRFHRRILVTIVGIMVSVMFVISSFIVVNSLYTSTGVLLDKFKKGNSVIYEGDSLSGSKLDYASLDIPGEMAVGILVQVKLNGTVPTYLVGLQNPEWDTGSVWLKDLNVSDREIRVGKNLYTGGMKGNVSVTSSYWTSQRLVNGTFSSRLFPDSWLIGSIKTARELAPWLEQSECSFILVRNTTMDIVKMAQDRSLNVNEMPSAVSFYAEGTNQIERDLWFIVAIAAVIITILIYTTMSMELYERKREIGIMRGIGANSEKIFLIFFSQTMLIASLGALLGVFIGIISSYAVTSLGVHMGYKTLFVVNISPTLILAAIGMTLTAATAGGIYPVVRATRMTVTECMER